ncbi:MAG: inositol monophosphatase family protein [Chloroflexota bacterium]
MQDRLQLAIQLARRAGGLLLEGYGRATHVSLKGSIDLVTEYDVKSEQLLVEGIRSAFPEDGIVSEEEGGEEGQGYNWFVDPLDGTTNFAHGLPIFSISIACMRGEDLLVGLIYDPVREELYRAVAGEGAYLNDTRIQVSTASELGSSLLVTGFPYDIRTNPDNNLNYFNALAVRARAVRRLGSAALDLAYVAAGRLDGYWELRLNPWDWAAGVLLVREAGGRVTNFRGDAKVRVGEATLVATNGRIHEQMLEALNTS